MRTIFSVLEYLATVESDNMWWLSLCWVRLGQQAVSTIHIRLGGVNMCWLSLCWVRLGQQTYHFYNEWPKTLNDPMTTLIPFTLCFFSYQKEWLKTPNYSIFTYSFLIDYKTINYLWKYKITKWPINRRSFFLILRTENQRS